METFGCNKNSTGYVEDLQRKAQVAAMQQRSDSGESESTPRPAADPNFGHGVGVEATRRNSSSSVVHLMSSSPRSEGQAEEPATPRTEYEAATLTNLLSTGRSTYMTAEDGMQFYLGTSSNWSFTRKILSMTHEQVFGSPLPAKDLLFDGCVYELDWDGSRTSAGPESPVLPTLDHAIYLINAVKFHCGQVFHLFSDDGFMPALYDFYERSSPQSVEEELWYVHLLLILAFGKAFTSKKGQGRRAPVL
ncbi:hypothetical protein N0V82_008571 [Gnomoniopsis sp. IMI 355080]|nr:hypothetical protein N0V82_008571 [Gnomoniopsis sp. IMI 355080]